MRGRVVAVMGVAAFAAAWVASGELQDPDAWWHVVNGAAVLDTGAEAPLSTFGAHGCPDATPLSYRFSDPAFALLWRSGGLVALWLLRLIAAVAFALGAGALLGRMKQPATAAVFASLCAVCIANRLAARPELFSYVLCSAVVALGLALLEGGSRRRLVVGALAIAAVERAWTDVHSGFLLGPMLLGVMSGGVVVEALVAGALDRARLGRAAVATGAAVLGMARPSSWSVPGYAAIERHIALDVVPIVEWQSPFVLAKHNGVDLPLAVYLVLAAAWLLALAARARPGFWPRWLLGGALLALGLDSARSLPLFALGSVLWLPFIEDAPRLAVRGLAGAGAVIGGALLISLAPSSALLRDGPWTERILTSASAPVRVARFTADAHLGGTLFGRMQESDWFLLDRSPDIAPVWTGRRTYEPACGARLLAARTFPARAFAAVDDVLHPDLVLVATLEEDPLFRFLVEQGFGLAFLEPRYALFVRPGRPVPPGGIPSTPDAALAGEARPLSDDAAAGLLIESCRRLAFAGRAEAVALCEGAVRRDPDNPKVQAEAAGVRAFFAAGP